MRHSAKRPTLMRIAVPLALLSGLAVWGQQAPSLRDFNDSLVTLTERLGPSVVQVFSNGYGAAPGMGPAGAAALQQNTGSGVVLTAEGHILTNAHVVAGASRIQVVLPPARPASGDSLVKPRGELVRATLVGVDPETDLAVLKVDAGPLTPLGFGDSDRVRQGQLVLVLGHPLGLDLSVSLGVVSATARQLQPEDSVVYLQTDAPINPGNSGGPLVDVEGRVVGINTLIFSQGGGNEGVGFAVPSNIVRTVADQIRATGRVTRGFIGVEAQTITPALAAGLGLPRAQGVVVADVMPKGPADLGDVRVGDVVLSLNGKPMENARQLQVNLYGQPIGKEVTLQVVRGTETLNRKVMVVDRPSDPDRLSRLVEGKVANVPRLGILAVALDRTLLPAMPGLRRPHGILVASRAVSATGVAGLLQPGDVIYSFDSKPLSTMQELQELLQAKREGDVAVLQVERSGGLRYVEVVLE